MDGLSRFRLASLYAALVCLLTWPVISFAGSLALPSRSNAAASESQLASELEPLPLAEREARVFQEVMRGNVPSWWRQLVPVRSVQTRDGVQQEIVFEVTPDYLALGDDADYLLMPMTPGLAQQIADRLDCILPTRKMVDLIWSNSVLKLSPQPIPTSLRMTSIPVFADHNRMVRAQRDALTNTFPQGVLVSGHKKDIVIASAVYPQPKHGPIRRPVVIYGWHQTNGVAIQPLYNGHDETYADYSHGVRLVLQRCRLNGADARVEDLLTKTPTAALLSDDPSEGGMGCVIARPFYPRRGN